MQFDLDLNTGTVKAEFSLAEFQQLVAAMHMDDAPQPPVATPKVFELAVESDTKPGVTYLVRIWHDIQGGEHASCECPHHTFRGAWCKHIRYAMVHGSLLLR